MSRAGLVRLLGLGVKVRTRTASRGLCVASLSNEKYFKVPHEPHEWESVIHHKARSIAWRGGLFSSVYLSSPPQGVCVCACTFNGRKGQNVLEKKRKQLVVV